MTVPHPEWGPCDGYGPGGECSECTGAVASASTGGRPWSPSSEEVPPCVQHLASAQRQLDADGIEVGVSRQALEEALLYVATLRTALATVTLRAEQAERERDVLVNAIDTELINTHLGVFNAGDDPKAALAKLGAWYYGVGEYFATKHQAGGA